jgi:hypothetical protein
VNLVQELNPAVRYIFFACHPELSRRASDKAKKDAAAIWANTTPPFGHPSKGGENTNYERSI